MIGTLPAVEPTTALNKDPFAEAREWVSDEATDMPLTTSARIQVSTISLSLDDSIHQLIAGEYDDGPEELMGMLQAKLRQGDRRLADQLTAVALSEQHNPEARSLALETLVAARARVVEPQAAEAVRVALEAPHPRLQFAGIAAASDLSRRHQISLSRVIHELVDSPTTSASVRRAGATFLRRRL